MSRRAELELLTNTGGALCCVDQSGDSGPYLRWEVGPHVMFGIAKNDVRTRRFLRNALRRLEKAAAHTEEPTNGK